MPLRPVTRRFDRSGEEVDRLGRGITPYAGGTDLIPLTRSGVLQAPHLTDLDGLGLSSEIERSDDEWVVGALTTLTALEAHPDLARDVEAVGQALRQVATLQIRNRATVGGNLLQRPRCSYFRDPDVSCWMKGGDDCPARHGRNELHGLDGQFCVATQPSDLAAVLVALDAAVDIGTAGSEDTQRSVHVADFLAAPTPERRSLHTLQDGELVRAIRFAAGGGRRSAYLKAMNRAVWQFALVGVAAVVDVAPDGTVATARLVASGLGNTPVELTAAADVLVGAGLEDESIAEAARQAVSGRETLSENAYKLPLLRGLVIRTLEQLRPTD